MRLSSLIAGKRNQWLIEAVVFCARHGRDGGKFNVSIWANGAVMVEVPGARANQAIPFDVYVALKDSNWTVTAYN